jgi:hypothetical protein
MSFTSGPAGQGSQRRRREPQLVQGWGSMRAMRWLRGIRWPQMQVSSSLVPAGSGLVGMRVTGWQVVIMVGVRQRVAGMAGFGVQG